MEHSMDKKGGESGHTRREQVLSKHLRGRGKAWAAIVERDQPLQLLDLPVDVLQAIIKEVTHTNDLTSLALTHSALHTLVTPHIYSRFDIVWPDSNAALDSRVGVDALTYGLATLVMAQDVFGEPSDQVVAKHPPQKCRHCGKLNACHHVLPPPRKPRIRRGNNFGRYTRKFSLGNGPADWVQEYALTREGGKMLGTLVALAVGRMRNLESFTWDMGTGVLRDVWLALASLADRDDGEDCRLERVWVRWHDNSDQPVHHSSPQYHANPSLIHPAASSGSPSLFHIPPYPRVEFPTFSVLPPLKSLNVLEVDELSYVEEMSVLIERSISKLTELRVGIALHAQSDPWVNPSPDARNDGAPVTAGPADQMSRPGGVLGILCARFCDPFQFNMPVDAAAAESPFPTTEPAAATTEWADDDDGSPPIPLPGATHSPSHLHTIVSASMIEDEEGSTEEMGTEMSASDLLTEAFARQDLGGRSEALSASAATRKEVIPATPCPGGPADADPNALALKVPRLDGEVMTKLRLEVMELERVPISIPVLSRAIDWSRLSTLTILGCRNHEQLWKGLRRKFAPRSTSRASSLSLKTPGKGTPSVLTGSKPSTPKSMSASSSSYSLKITYLHTDCVSPSLLTFIHTTLAPDTLTHLFLQECSEYPSPVSVDSIYKLAIRRHRASLRKLLLDSTIHQHHHNPSADQPTTSNNWRHWLPTRDLLSAITSGKMHLRELSIAIDYKDWHFFLQRLPHAKEIRSLHITHVAEHPHSNVHGRVDAREAALQVLDIVALRPELELCYLGVLGKCFEVLEFDNKAERQKEKGAATDNSGAPAGSFISAGQPGSDGESEEEDENGAAGQGGPANNDLGTSAQDGFESDIDLMAMSMTTGTDTTDDEGTGHGKGRSMKSFRLREILFYDDKVSIFRARHGKL